MTCEPYQQKEVEGRGIFPDKEIIPTINDRVKGKDVEMEWIIQEINGAK